MLAAYPWRQRSCCIAILAGMLLAVQLVTSVDPAHGAEIITISDAWVPAVEQVGGNVALSMTIRNTSDIADALVRVRCEAANFAVKHTVDRGEGAPAMREISAIPIAAGGTTVLKPDGFHIMLLQTRQPLAVGDAMNCSIVFQKAGTIETEVKVHGQP